MIDQPIFGTAAPAKSIWLLLEVPHPWAGRALENNDLPAVVQELLTRWQEQVPEAQLAFIKKEQVRHRRRRFFVAVAGENDRRLYRFLLDDIADLAGFDLESIVQDDGRHEQHRLAHPLFLVCTNGRRDRCCAKFGLPVYQSLCRALEKERDGAEQVWQCTHLGGHRYAPVVAALPVGLTVRLENDFADQAIFLEAVKENRLWLDGYRGRSCFERPVQAAEYYLRSKTGMVALDDFTLCNVSRAAAPDTVRVVFKARLSEAHHELTIRVGQTEPLLASCGKAKYKRQPRYALLEYRVGS